MSGEDMLVQVSAWKRLDWLRHGFSTRRGGVSTVYRAMGDGSGYAVSDDDRDLNLGWTKEDDPGFVTENRRRLVAALGGIRNNFMPLITVRQVHSAASLVVSGPEVVFGFVGADGRAILEADGLMTGAAGVLLGIQTADCVPVLVADTRVRAVACFHAGWRGTAARIVEREVSQMMAKFGSRKEDLVAAIGPAIGVCCYSVGEEVREAFRAEFSYGEALFRTGAGDAMPTHLDLWEANRRQLIAAGVSGAQITTVGECTGCAGLPGRRRYFSHRREHGFTGRMMSVIGIAAGSD